jgi:hypothetical protein
VPQQILKEEEEKEIPTINLHSDNYSFKPFARTHREFPADHS